MKKTLVLVLSMLLIGCVNNSPEPGPITCDNDTKLVNGVCKKEYTLTILTIFDETKKSLSTFTAYEGDNWSLQEILSNNKYDGKKVIYKINGQYYEQINNDYFADQDLTIEVIIQ